MSHAYLNKLAAEAGVTEQLRETPLLTYYAYVDKEGNELGSDGVIDIALEHLVQKASDAMKERAIYFGLAGNTIRALPSITLEDIIK